MVKKKLLVFASTFPRWKNDTNPPFVYELSKRLTKDFDVYVLAPSFPGAKDYEVMDKMKVYRFHYFIKKYEKLAGGGGILPTLKKNKLYYLTVPFFMAAEYFALKRLVKKINPDIIHAHWIIPQGFVAYLNHKVNKTPYIVTTWGADMFIFKKKGVFVNLLKSIYRKILNNSKKSTTVNKVFLSEMQSVMNYKKNAIYIPNGADTKLFNPNKKDNSIKKKHKINGPLLLFVGRLAEKKGVRYLIEAIPEIIKRYPKVKLMIVGSGSLENQLKIQAKELKLNKNIIFIGAIQNSQLPKYYATADLFIAPSITTREGDREGFPAVFVESMASGTPILTTRIDGIKEIIEAGKNGFVVESRSSNELGKNLLEILSKKDRLEKMKKYSRKLAVENYDWKILGKRYEEILG